jgi:hypothetical protein
MDQESTIYLTNIVIGVILAGLVTHYWLAQGRTAAMRFWMIAAWTMAAADVLFAARPELSNWVGRFVPTILVTLGHATLLLGARTTAKHSRPWKLLAIVVLGHAAALIYFLLLEQKTPWRLVTNGVVWASLSLAAFAALRQASGFFWRPIVAPANVFLLHAAFHLARMGLALASAAGGWAEVSNVLQIIGDLEVSFFMVALFVALLIATLQQRHEELTSARAEVETLSGLLPICAWCKKVRDDDGYWQQVEEFFEKRDRIRFTHGICADCANDQMKDQPAAFSPKDDA